MSENCVECLVCHKKFKIITLTHLRTHNLDFKSYKNLFINVELVSDTRKKEVSLQFIGKTKPPISDETRELMSRSHKGKIVSSETKLRISVATKGKKKSEKVRENISKGLKGRVFTEEWMKKLRKPKSESAKMKMSESAKLKFINNPNLREHLSELTTKQFLNPKYGKIVAESNRRRTIHGGGPESSKHLEIKNKIKDILISLGYDVTLEKFITVENKRYAIDVYAKNNEKTMLFEVGECRLNKMFNLLLHFSYVYQVPKI